ncbi:hypothetical protein [Halorussus lipolyticus]|uniref:hypothetical protein n=1 Tax=Halorussus lipolyticus TaxID=3034024 RepID=UPI0023E772D5|nr:hypothetical protein [Halorussus sp. DT80]
MTLLALAPVALFALGRSLLAVVAVVNVVLIFGSLYLLTSPTEEDHGHDHGERTDDERAREKRTAETTDST